jgi:predicted nucleic acid-binding protein
MLLLDTDVLIDVQRGHPAALAWCSALPVPPSAPGLVVMELIPGARDAADVRAALRLTAPLPVVWPTAADCQRALTEFATLHLSHGLGLLDSLIGATAVGLGAELCTFNDKHYRGIPGLVLTRPYTR